MPYGQELNAQTWALCTMNMFLHRVDDARIWQGDTLSNPQNIEDDKLMKFQVVVANPPFSLDKWDSGFLTDVEADSKGKKKMTAELDPYHRFDWGVPPTSKGDYAFVLHMLAAWMQKMAVWPSCCPMASSSVVPAKGKFAASWWR